MVAGRDKKRHHRTHLTSDHESSNAGSKKARNVRWSDDPTPPEDASMQISDELSLVIEVTYAANFTEIFARWGGMSLLVWVLWRLVQQGKGHTLPGVVWAGNVSAAVIWGVVMYATNWHLTNGYVEWTNTAFGVSKPVWAALVEGQNTVAGVGFGWLFWRRGLEAAMLAHILKCLLCYCFYALLGMFQVG